MFKNENDLIEHIENIGQTNNEISVIRNIPNKGRGEVVLFNVFEQSFEYIKKVIILKSDSNTTTKEIIYTDIIEFESLSIKKLNRDYINYLKEQLFLLNKIENKDECKMIAFSLRSSMRDFNETITPFYLKMTNDSKAQKRIFLYIRLKDLKNLANKTSVEKYELKLPIVFNTNYEKVKLHDKSNDYIRDAFFTKESIAKNCISLTDDFLSQAKVEKPIFWIEPSAGSGAFYNNLPGDNKIGLDIRPENHNIIKKDFFKFSLSEKLKNNYIVVIGNPPFGRKSSLAVKFFNQAARFSSVIAFIVPKTFRKASFINQLNDNFHLKAEHEIEDNAFELNGKSYDVPCIFQIWVLSKNKREKSIRNYTHKDFVFSNNKNADFAIQRVGVNAGKVKLNIKELSSSSHYFIKSNVDVIKLREIFENINWSTVKNNTAGNPSISKTELISLYNNSILNLI